MQHTGRVQSVTSHSSHITQRAPTVPPSVRRLQHGCPSHSGRASPQSAGDMNRALRSYGKAWDAKSRSGTSHQQPVL